MRTARFRGPGSSEWTFDIPTSRRERVRGLRDRRGLGPRDGMLFPRCRSVHTFGMAFAIAVVSLDDHLTVLDVRVVRPKRVLVPRRRTRHIVECAFDAPIEIGGRFEGDGWSEV